MSTPKAKAENICGLTMAEAKVLVMSTLLSQEKVDYEKLAQVGGYKTAASASTTYRNARRKMTELHGSKVAGNDASSASADATDATDGQTAEGQTTNTDETPKKTPVKRKKKAAAAADADAASPEGATVEGEDSTAPAPKPKRQRKTPVKKAAVKAEGSENEVKTPVKTEANSSPGFEVVIPTVKVKEENMDDALDDSNIEAEIDAMDDSPSTVKQEPVKQETVAV